MKFIIVIDHRNGDEIVLADIYNSYSLADKDVQKFISDGFVPLSGDGEAVYLPVTSVEFIRIKAQ